MMKFWKQMKRKQKQVNNPAHKNYVRDHSERSEEPLCTYTGVCTGRFFAALRMTVVLLCVSVILLLASVAAFAQTPQFKEWDSATLEKANTAKDIDYLTIEEKNAIFYINLARTNGPLFVKTFVLTYLDSTEMESNDYAKSLIRDLNKSKPIALLTSRKDLYEVAKTHAKTMGKSGKTGHYEFEKRTREIARIYDGITENCDYGPDDGFSIVMDLLIDEGIPEVGHRATILDPDVRYMGASIKKHKKYRYNCVMEFGGELLK